MAERLVTFFYEQGGPERRGVVRIPDGHEDIDAYVKRFIEAANNVRPLGTKPITFIRMGPDA